MTSNNSEMRCSEYYVQPPNTDHTGDQTGLRDQGQTNVRTGDCGPIAADGLDFASFALPCITLQWFHVTSSPSRSAVRGEVWLARGVRRGIERQSTKLFQRDAWNEGFRFSCFNDGF